MSLVRINQHPARAQLLLFAVAWLLAFGWLALVLSSRGHPVLAATTGMGALAMPVLWFVANEPVRLAFVGLSYATFPIGFVVSHVLLLVIYYGVFTPIGLVMRACGRDPLQRKFDRSAATYWERRSGAARPSDYLRQR